MSEATKRESADRPLAGFGCRDAGGLVLGERADGTIVHVSEVPSGERCGCTCPGCGDRLVARKGPINEHHFGHKGRPAGSTCATGPETALHKSAKQVLASRLSLRLPTLRIVGKEEAVDLFNDRVFQFDEAIVESRLGAIVPDVIVRKGGRELLVEFEVTHPCGPEKLAWIRERDLSAIQIDLSGLPRDVSRDGLAEAILETASRTWLHNRHSAKGHAHLERERERRQAQRNAKALRTAKRYREADRSIRSLRPSSKIHAALVADGCTEALGLDVPGIGSFTVAPGDWQALCLSSLLSHTDGLDGRVAAPTLLKMLREASWTRDFANQEEAKAIREVEKAFATPYEAILAWAREACSREILYPVGNASWVVNSKVRQRIRESHLRRRLPSQRRSEIQAIVAGIVGDLPAVETRAFVFDAWFRGRLPGRDFGAADILQHDDDRYDPFRSDLQRLASSIRSRPRGEHDLLGLPLHGLVRRSLVELRQKEEREDERRRAENERRETERIRLIQLEADERVAELRGMVRRELGHRTTQWLAAVEPILGCSPEAAARSGRDELRRAIAVARELGTRQRAIDKAEDDARTARRMLVSEASKIYAGEVLELYLGTSDYRLGGMSPMTYCVNLVMLKRCLMATLPSKKHRR